MDDQLSNLKLEAYKSLRDEINHHWQGMATVLGVALTATAAIGAVGLNKTGNRDALLVLPFVLSGLGLVQETHAIQIRRLGEYIRTYLWPPTDASTGGLQPTATPPPSYEEWMARMRRAQSDFYPTKAALFVGNLVIFFIPSAGALALTRPGAWGSTSLSIVWAFGVLILVGATAFVLAVERLALGPSDKYPQERLRPPETLERRGS